MFQIDRRASADPTESLALAQKDYLAGRYAESLQRARLVAGQDVAQASLGHIAAARALLRLQRPSEAVSELISDVPELTNPEQIAEAKAVLAIAHGSMLDFETADAYVQDLLNNSELSAPTRSQIGHTAALVAWMRNDLKSADAALAIDYGDDSAFARGRNMIMAGWIAARREQFSRQAELMMHGAELHMASEHPDIGILASTERALAALARDLPMPNLLPAAIRLYEQLPWTDDLAVDQFSTARALGWAVALQGPSRYFESLRLLHKASASAPSPAWRVYCLADRAAMKRYAGEIGASTADLYDALELAKSVAWAATNDEERVALILTAEVAASVDVRQASALMLQYSQLSQAASGRLVMRGDRRVEAYRTYSSGIIQETLNDRSKAQQFYKSAFDTWDAIGFHWRAARVALALFRTTGDAKWHEIAREKIRDYPESWIAADIREASSKVADDAWHRMTPRQREVFQGLCEGLTAKRISDRLDCSPNTVRNHIHWVYQAFRVSSQAELITEARKRRLL